jgi:hypothetical protein
MMSFTLVGDNKLSSGNVSNQLPINYASASVSASAALAAAAAAAAASGGPQSPRKSHHTPNRSHSVQAQAAISKGMRRNSNGIQKLLQLPFSTCAVLGKLLIFFRKSKF